MRRANVGRAPPAVHSSPPPRTTPQTRAEPDIFDFRGTIWQRKPAVRQLVREQVVGDADRFLAPKPGVRLVGIIQPVGEIRAISVGAAQRPIRNAHSCRRCGGDRCESEAERSPQAYRDNLREVSSPTPRCVLPRRHSPLPWRAIFARRLHGRTRACMKVEHAVEGSVRHRVRVSLGRRGGRR